MSLQLKNVRKNWRTIILAITVGLLAFTTVADGHGLGSEDPNRPVIDYLWLGTKHLLAGWDHLLFILAVILVAGSLWRATKLISLFVLGHSITLLVATLAEWQVSTTFVDIVITLSVVAVAVAGLRGKEMDWRLFGGALFAFGLIHGLGLSTRLQELGVADDALIWRVLLFNIGVELGQALAVLAFAGIGWLIVTFWGDPVKAKRPLFMVIALAGLIGTMLLTLPGPDEEVTDEPVVAEEQTAACRVVQEPTEPSGLGSHAEKTFYGPDEDYPVDDFNHSMLDGYIVVTYRSDIGEGDLVALQRTVEGGQEGLLAGAVPDQGKVLVATTTGRQLRCDAVDTEALEQFRDRWIAEVTG